MSKSSARERTWFSLRAAMLCSAVLSLVAAGVGLGVGRDRIVETMRSVPRPRAMKTAAVALPVEEPGGIRSVSDARRLGEAGDVAGALRLLRAVPREDPAFPAAQRLMSDLEAAGLRGGKK